MAEKTPGKKLRRRKTGVPLPPHLREPVPEEPAPSEMLGTCPYCSRRSLARKRRGAFRFWGCQNPVCSLMFWRLPFPRMDRRVRPLEGAGK